MFLCNDYDNVYALVGENTTCSYCY